MATIRLVWFYTPHKYPVPGTKVRIASYTHSHSRDTPPPIYSGMVMGPEPYYASPFEQSRGFDEEGVYFEGDPRWEQLWVVRLDDEFETLEQRQLRPQELIAGYRWGIPILHWFMSPHMRRRHAKGIRKIGDLPYPIKFYQRDYVIYENDESQTPRMVRDVWFELDGKLVYSLAETLKERRARYAAIATRSKEAGSTFVQSGGSELKYQNVSESELSLAHRGNYYHLANSEPGALVFPHVTLEVEFWQRVGIWIGDNGSDLTIDESVQKLTSGEIDSVNTERQHTYNTIVLPERFAKFRERSRSASLEYLRLFVGKYSFDIVPKDVIAEYKQTDL